MTPEVEKIQRCNIAPSSVGYFSACQDSYARLALNRLAAGNGRGEVVFRVSQVCPTRLTVSMA